MVGDDGLVVLPPAAKGEGLGGLVAVHRKGDGELCPEFRLDAQQLQHAGVGGGLVGPFRGQAALDGVAEGPVSFILVRIADLHMRFVEGYLGGHPQIAPQAPGLDAGVFFQFVELGLGQVFEPAVVKTAALAEVGLLHPLVDGEGNGE